MSWYGLTQKPIRFPQPIVTTTSLPQATVPSWVEAERAAALPAIDALTKEQAA